MNTWDKNLTYFNVISIDPATNHFALRIEKRNFDGNIEPLAWSKENFKVEESEINTNKKYVRIIEYLKGFDHIFKTCHYMIIERQLHINYKAVRISQNAISYFLTKFPEILCVEVSPRLKTWGLGAPKGLNERQIKDWAIIEADKILEMRRDIWSIERFRWKPKGKKEKKDDLADTVVQVEGLFKLWGFPYTNKLI